MRKFKVLPILILVCGFCMFVHAFDPKEGYPRSKYSKSNGNIEKKPLSSSKQDFLDSDFAMYYECGAQTAENHPWIAVLEHTDPTDKTKRKTLSKGVLIGPEHVLTTVSSIHNSHPFWVVSGVR